MYSPVRYLSIIAVSLAALICSLSVSAAPATFFPPSLCPRLTSWIHMRNLSSSIQFNPIHPNTRRHRKTRLPSRTAVLDTHTHTHTHTSVANKASTWLDTFSLVKQTRS
ncbi:hypothetical protein IWX47DRAFT_873070, partial [Phyllosticta citricarpa]